MLPDDQKEPAEKSNPLIFIPITVFGIYLIYLAAAFSYQIGAGKGELLASYKVPVVAGESEDEVFDLNQLRQFDPELATVGARLYAANCASCHGATGEGNGAAGLNLAVKPRNFHNPDGWQVGASPLQMYETLTVGLGSMPNFPAMNPRQKFAVIHYIHQEHMGMEFPEDDPARVASLPAPAAGGGPVKIDVYGQKRVPVNFAIQKMLRAADAAEVTGRPATN